MDQIKVVDAFGYPSNDSLTLNMGNGANSLIAGTDAAYFGHFRYNGGTGTDSLVFGSGALYGNDSIVDLGNDTAADEITFLGTAGFGLPNHPAVQNFDTDDGDMIYLPTGVTADISEITAYGTDLTWEDYSGHYCLTFADLSSIGSDPTSVADLVASFA